MEPELASGVINLGDCVGIMEAMPDESVDAVVTDPPYNLGFMGKAWDSKHQHEPWAREAFRLLKPGGHLLAFGGTRTYHRLACAIEDAGFEIRDCLVWGYASGFPKSLDVSKAIDRMNGDVREAAAHRRGAGTPGNTFPLDSSYMTGPAASAASAASAAWGGYGTALKPAWEPIVMARKPLRGTVAANVLEYGTGALNIDGTRIGTDGGSAGAGAGAGAVVYSDGLNGPRAVPVPGLGRWPANIVLTDPIFDGDVDGVVGGGETQVAPNVHYSTEHANRAAFPLRTDDQAFYGDAGTYSRFFLIAKAARAEREPLSQPEGAQAALPGYGGFNSRMNLHPTVKPLELMRHLVRLVTPPGGVVLDPFLGSGTTAIACEMEGFAWIGIEKEPEYVAIAEARLNGVQRGLGLELEAPQRKRGKAKGHWPKDRTPGKDGWGFSGQTGLDERFEEPVA